MNLKHCEPPQTGNTETYYIFIPVVHLDMCYVIVLHELGLDCQVVWFSGSMLWVQNSSISWHEFAFSGQAPKDRN